jgi:hypothetical protein
MKTIYGATLVALCVVLICGEASAQRAKRPKHPPSQPAQQSEPKPETAPPMPVLPDIRNDSDVKAADVAIIANITIKEMRFDSVPDPKVEFLGKDKTTTIWHTDRYNLPDKIEPGVTYRNVGIRLKITSTLADIDRIVAEALGEIPVNDSNKSSPTTVTPGDRKNEESNTPTAPETKKPERKSPNE